MLRVGHVDDLDSVVTVDEDVESGNARRTIDRGRRLGANVGTRWQCAGVNFNNRENQPESSLTRTKYLAIKMYLMVPRPDIDVL